MPGVQESEMRGVDLALERLQVIAVALDEGHLHLVLGKIENLERRQRRGLRARAHVDPHDAGALHHLVGLGLHLLLEARRRQARHVDAVARNVELPAVIDAANALFLVAPEEQRCAAMRTAVIHHADPAGAIAKRDEFLAEQHQANRRTIAHKLGRHQRRDPVAAHQIAHHGACADARQLDAIRCLAHAILPGAARHRLRACASLSPTRSP